MAVDGELIFFNLPTPGFAPDASGQFAFAARTGGASETLMIDDIAIFLNPVRYAQDFEHYADGAVEGFGDGAVFLSNTPLSGGVHGGAMRLTRDGTPDTRARFVLPPIPTVNNSGSFSASFDFLVSAAGTPADGFSFNYGAIATAADGSEDGFGTGLTVGFDTYDNGGGDVVGNTVFVNGVQAGQSHSNPRMADGAWHTALVEWSALPPNSGRLTLTIDRIIIFSEVATPGFVPAEGDVFAFMARTGGATETALIDNIVIHASEASQTADDSYEENDTRTSAYELTTSLGSLSSLSGEGAQLDDDWFQVTALSGSLYVHCSFLHAEGDVDLEIYDSGGGLAGFSRGIGDSEEVFGVQGGAGTYYVRVYGPGRGNSYDLFWWSEARPREVRIESVRLTGAGGVNVEIRFASEVGKAYSLERKLGLNQEWREIQSNINGNGEAVVLTDPGVVGSSPDAYYRIVRK